MVHVLRITVQKFGHFMLFFRGQQRRTKNYNAHAQLFQCSLNSLFSDIAIAIMVFFRCNSLISHPVR